MRILLFQCFGGCYRQSLPTVQCRNFAKLDPACWAAPGSPASTPRIVVICCDYPIAMSQCDMENRSTCDASLRIWGSVMDFYLFLGDCWLRRFELSNVPGRYLGRTNVPTVNNSGRAAIYFIHWQEPNWNFSWDHRWWLDLELISAPD